MPVVSLPDDLIQQLSDSESGTINDTQGPGVAVYWSENRTVRADIYIGFKFDGFRRYQNISSVDPTIKMQFALPPTISCEGDDFNYDPSEGKLIRIMVIRLILIMIYTVLYHFDVKKTLDRTSK